MKFRAILTPILALAATSSVSLAVTLADYTGSFSPDPTRYESSIAAFKANDSKKMPPAGAIVGVGSSSMVGWHYRINVDLEGLTIIPRGFGGSVTSDVIYYANDVILNYNPRAVIIYEGDNDIGSGKSPQVVLDDMKFLVDLCRTTDPNLRFYFISIKPSGVRWGQWATIQQANQLLKEYCEVNEGLTFIDVSDALLDDVTGLPIPEAFQNDNLHLSDYGYDLWASAIAPVVIAGEADFEGICEDCRELEAGDEVLIDFGADNRQVTSPTDGNYWNNIWDFATLGALLPSSVTSSNDKVLLAVSISDTFQGVNPDGVATSTTWPAAVVSDSFWTGSFDSHAAALMAPAMVELKGLPADLRYRITAFPSRTGNDSGAGRLTRYSIGSAFIDVEASDNRENVAVFENLTPDSSGAIAITVAASPDGTGRFAYLNALKVEAVSSDSAGVWGPFPVQEGEMVDTLGWIGFLYVGGSPWIYNYAMERWLYIEPASISESGAWAYLPR